MNNEKKRGRPMHYNHITCRKLINSLPIPSEATRMQVLNILERACGYWFEAAGGEPDEFQEWYDQRTKERI